MELFKPDAGLLFWTLLSFLILFFILKKYAWPGILKGIAKRNKHIQRALVSAKKAEEKYNELQIESDTIIQQAKEEQIKILQEGKRIKDNILSEAKEQAKIEAVKIIEEAHKFIAMQKEDAIKEIDKKIANLSIDIAEKILRKELANPEEQNALAQKLANKISDN